jgi:HSP20 family molecular chaperone IbpA
MRVPRLAVNRRSRSPGRHFAHDSAEEKMHRTEHYYGAFRRSITLPSYVEADKIEASTRDDVLQIMVPKAPDVQAKRIQVRASLILITTTAAH